MRNLAYFTSERFIHDDLAAKAAEMVEQLRATWKRTQAMEDYALTWPRTDIATDDGGHIEGAIICKLPRASREERIAVLHKMAERTKAYGLVLIEQANNALCVWFETQHGARVWRMPLARHGDVVVCGAPEVTEDKEALHILWRGQVALN